MTTEKHLEASNSVFLEMNVGLNFRGLTALLGSENELGNSNLFPFFFSLSFKGSTGQPGWLLSKSLQAINAGEDVEKREPSYTVGGNAN